VHLACESKGLNTRRRSESVDCESFTGGYSARALLHEVEHVGCDPKDGELCLGRVKPVETPVEARSGSDVQIDRVTWV
jgi:hypothetical protein